MKCKFRFFLLSNGCCPLLHPQQLKLPCNLRLQGGDVRVVLGQQAVHLCQVDGGFLLKGIHVSGDVQIVVIVGDLLGGGQVGVLVHIVTGPAGGDDLVDAGVGQEVLVLAFLKFLAGVDEQDVPVLASPLQHQDGGGDAGAVEQIGGQADDRVQGVLLLDEGLADLGLRRPPEQHPVGQDDGHGPLGVQVVVAVEHEGEVRLGGRRQLAVIREPGILELGLRIVPFGRVRWVGHHGVEAPGPVDAPLVGAVGPVPLQGVGVAQGHVVVPHPVHHEVHAGQVVGGGIELLAVKLDGAGAVAPSQLIPHGEEQGPGAHGGVVDGEGPMAGPGAVGDDFGQHLADLMGGVELPALLAGGGGKLADEVFVDDPEDVPARGVLVLDLVHQLDDAVEGFGPGGGGAAQPGIPQVDVVKDAAEVPDGVLVQGGVGVEVVEEGLVIAGDDGAAVDAVDQGGPGVFGLDGVTQGGGDVFQVVGELVAPGLFPVGGVGVLVFGDFDGVAFDQVGFLVFGEIAVEHEGEDVVLEFPGVHVTPELVGHGPELGGDGVDGGLRF